MLPGVVDNPLSNEAFYGWKGCLFMIISSVELQRIHFSSSINAEIRKRWVEEMDGEIVRECVWFY